VTDEKIKIIFESLKKHKNKNPSKPIFCLIECPNISSLSPESIVGAGKIFMKSYEMPDRGLYE